MAVHVAVAVAALVLFLLLSRRSKRRTSTTVPPSGEFDYIVVGGGLAGSVLAARLSEDASKRVLVDFGTGKGLYNYAAGTQLDVAADDAPGVFPSLNGA